MNTTNPRNGVLWRYGLTAALVTLPVVWILQILILSITQRWMAWPPPGMRTILVYSTLVFSLVPLILWLLDFAVVRPASAKRAEGRRSEALATIDRNRVAYEDMSWRAKAVDQAVVVDATVIARFEKIADAARETTDEEALAALEEEAETLAQRRAYLCPEKEIATEAKSHLFTLVDWGVPSKKIDSLKVDAAPALDVKDVGAARGALHVIFEEYDAWAAYIDEYNANTSFWASVFLAIIAIAAPAALALMFGFSPRMLALVLAAIAGATASVIARLPGLTSYGEWEVNLRAYKIRIGTGIVGSLVGIGLLGSGVITITLPKDWKTADALLEACLPRLQAPASVAPIPPTPAPPADSSSPPATPARCDGGGLLFLLAITMLLGFSERLLTSLEGRVVGAGAGTPASGKT